ncbi:MarR family winged helix-turn-helix transcriptional regulator [Chloroflexota bacterium]
MDKTKLIEEVIKLRIEASQLLGRFAQEAWKNLDVPLAQLKSLFMITCEGTTNFRKLSDNLGVTPGDVTGIIDRLVKQGLVSRGEDPQDRRVITLQATDKGRILLADLRESRANQIAQILARMNSEELRSLSYGLSAFIRSLKETNENS